MGDDRATAQLLVVDDDDAMRHLLRRHLEQAGHVVVDAADLASAVELLTHARFDLVLLDLHLGSRSGLELFDAPGIERPPTIVLSGAGDDSAVKRSHEVGACDFLRKPVSGVELCERVRVALSGSRRARPIAARRVQPRTALPAVPPSR